VAGAGVVICLGQGADLHMAQLMPLPLTVSCFSKIHIGFTFLVPRNPGQGPEGRKTDVCACVILRSKILNSLRVSLQQRRVEASPSVLWEFTCLVRLPP